MIRLFRLASAPARSIPHKTRCRWSVCSKESSRQHMCHHGKPHRKEGMPISGTCGGRIRMVVGESDCTSICSRQRSNIGEKKTAKSQRELSNYSRSHYSKHMISQLQTPKSFPQPKCSTSHIPSWNWNSLPELTEHQKYSVWEIHVGRKWEKAEGLERGEAARGGVEEELHQEGRACADRNSEHSMFGTTCSGICRECFGMVGFKQTSLI